MKKYIILLSITFLILSSILVLDTYLSSNRARELKENNKPQVTEFSIDRVSASEFPKALASKVPILMYHSISDMNPQSSLFVSPKSFESQVNYFIEHKYNFISFEDLDSGNIPKNPIILTFDDGYEDFYTNAYPILKKSNVKATVFIITGFIGKQGYLSLEEIKSMEGLISFQSHTVSHLDLKLLSDLQLQKELKDSKEKLQSIVKNKIVAISYPSGSFNSKVVNLSENYYKYGATTVSGTYNIETNRYKIPRIRISRRDNITSLANTIIRQ